MPLNFDDLEIPIYRFLADELALSEFEQWLYATPALEAFLGQPAYLELLSFRYNQPSANYELARLLRSVIEPARSDTWQIIYFLQSLLEGTSDAVEAFARLFDLYGQGYTFLENIAIAYDIGVYEIPTLRQQPLWEAGAFARQREALAEYIDPLRPEIQTILHGLETGAIRIISAGEYRLAPGWQQKLRDLRRPPQPDPEINVGAYNLLKTTLFCAHCQTSAPFEVEMRCGDTRAFETFALGDSYKWLPGKSIAHGGRPENGDLDADGYAECPVCGKDFFVTILIRADRLEAVRPNPARAGYMQTPSPASSPPVPAASSAAAPSPTPPAQGNILHNEKWNLTPSIKDTLTQLAQLGVDISSTVGGSDYTFLVPHGLTPPQYERIEALMQKIASEIRGRLFRVDWYPFGTKFRVYPAGAAPKPYR